ncbi:MAG: thiamine biosynthesis protein ThiS [Campylobacteraceae bacterium 4484_166]|nr:MAG: thiamine biosynthesis protein ThiS [Campylobacteraceae bacterium 4484_166]
MKLIINGDEMSFDDGVTIEYILDKLNIKDKVMAVAVNMNIIQKKMWQNYTPKQNDKIEFLQFVGGG